MPKVDATKYLGDLTNIAKEQAETTPFFLSTVLCCNRVRGKYSDSSLQRFSLDRVGMRSSVRLVARRSDTARTSTLRIARDGAPRYAIHDPQSTRRRAQPEKQRVLRRIELGCWSHTLHPRQLQLQLQLRLQF